MDAQLSAKILQQRRPIRIQQRLGLPRKSFVYDIRTGKQFGSVDRVTVRLDPYDPTLLAVANEPLPSLGISTAASVRAGQSMDVRFAFNGKLDGGTHVVHLALLSPDGKLLKSYSENILTAERLGSRTLTIPEDMQRGRWTVRGTDAVSGHSATASFDVVSN